MCWLCWSPDGSVATFPETSSRFQAEMVQPTAPRLFLATSGNPNLDGLFSGFAWTLGDPVSFAFPDSPSDYEPFYGSNEPSRGFAQIGPAMRDVVRKLLVGEAAGIVGGVGSPGAAVTAFTNLQIFESPQDSEADIRIARSSAPFTAWAYYPNGREGGDVWFGNRHAFDTPRLGTYQFMVATHELGHALGLKHPHETSNGFAALPLDRDGMEFTVMSYRSKIGGTTTSGYTNATFDYAQSWMMLDIAALQAMYGADYGWRPAATRYRWDPLTGETFIDGIGQGAPGDGAGGTANRVFLTIWDGGGIDTYDLSNYATGVLADLAPGGWSVLSAAQLATLDTRDGTKARGNVFNALLHQGNTASLIENAIGGVGADTLLGNQAANRLEGRAGADRLEGGAGSDVLIGGSGADTVLGGTGDDLFVVDDAGDLVTETPGEGLDAIIAERNGLVALPGHVEMLLLGLQGQHGRGNDLANLLIGNPFANRLEGGAGADVLQGGRGNDTLNGGPGADQFVLRRHDGIDRIEDFEPGADRLILTGFGLSAAELLVRTVAQAGGSFVDLGGGDGLLLVGIEPAQLLARDLIL